MKALSVVVQFPKEEVWHLLQTEHLTCCGRDTWVWESERPQGDEKREAARQMIAMVRSADLCPKCQEALANSRVSRAGLVHKKGAK